MENKRLRKLIKDILLSLTVAVVVFGVFEIIRRSTPSVLKPHDVSLAIMIILAGTIPKKIYTYVQEGKKLKATDNFRKK